MTAPIARLAFTWEALIDILRDYDCEQEAGLIARIMALAGQSEERLAEVWDEGVVFGWHSIELRTEKNPYRKAEL